MTTTLPSTHFPGSAPFRLHELSDSNWTELFPEQGRSSYGGDTATVVLWCEVFRGVVAHNPQVCDGSDEWFLSFDAGDTFYHTAATLDELLNDPAVITSLRQGRPMPMADIPHYERPNIRQDLGDVVTAVKKLLRNLLRS